MSEIKSTLDLIMERTRHLAMKPGELAQVQRGESARRARGLLALYLRGEKDRRALLRELKSLPEAHADAVREALRETLLEALAPGGDNRRALDTVEELEGAPAARAWEAACLQAAGAVGDGAGRRRAEARERFRERLASEGIAGTAVVPADARNPFLQEVEADLARRFREAVSASLGSS